MARNLQIHVRLECSIPIVKWRVETARLIRWRWQSGSYTVGIKLINSTEYPGLRQPVSASDLPPSLGITQSNEDQPIPIQARRVDLEVLVGSLPRNVWTQKNFDPWTVREAMLNLSTTTEKLCDFLNEFGVWDRLCQPRYLGPGAPTPVIVIPQHIWQTRSGLIEGMRNGPKKWFNGHRAPHEFFAAAAFPNYVHTDQSCVDAIATSITADFLDGVKFGICQRADCRKPFLLRGRNKIYCSQYCGHLESVRRSRGTVVTAG